MYPHSARFAASIATSGHTAIAGLDLELSDGSVRPLRASGSVTEDAQATERWTLDATVADPTLTALDLGSPLLPGSALRPWRGLRYPDGTEERIPLGVMLVGEPNSNLGGGTVSLRGEGRSTAIGLARLTEPWTITAGTLLSSAASDFLTDRLPGCPPVRLECDDVTLAETFLPAGADSDPWQSLVSETSDSPGLVFSAGRRLWFDADGVPVLTNLANQAIPVEVDGSTLTQAAQVSLDPSRTYGRVLVTSNALGDDVPLQAIREDPDPAIPSLAKRVYFAQLDALATQDAVDAAADSLLARVTGIRSQASWTQPPNPALRAGDVLTITGGPLEGTFEVARITTPWPTGLQQIEAVERVL